MIHSSIGVALIAAGIIIGLAYSERLGLALAAVGLFLIVF
jgi:hypothetical protein